MRMVISGRTEVFAVIGDPIEHTLSPIMHNAAFEHLGLDFIFTAFRVTPDELESAVRGACALGMRGLNVTMPHKNSVTEFLDWADPAVKFLGAANTIIIERGRLRGFNTDGVGALRALKNNGVNLSGKKTLLLGAGGAAKAIAFSLIKEVEELCILNRDAVKAREIAVAMEPFGKKIIGKELTPKQLQLELQDSAVLINATSCGMTPQVSESLIERDWLNQDLSVMDIVYNPIETKLIRDAKATGAKAINGLEMLLYQGAASLEIWTQCKAPVEVMRNALLSKIPNPGANI